MFGILYVGLLVIVFCISKSKMNKRSNESRKKAIRSGTPYYFDAEGKTRLTHDNRLVIFTYEHGDKVLMDAKTFDVIYNLSESHKIKKREERKKEAIENNKDFYLYTEKLRGVSSLENIIINEIYQEISTGKLYTINDNYYQSVQTDLLVKPVELYALSYRNNPDIIKKEMEIRNDRIVELKNKGWTKRRLHGRIIW